MIRPTTGPLRTLRSAVVAVVVVALASAAHLGGGGALPEAFPALALLVLVGSVAHLLTRWRMSVPLLLAVLGVGQVSLHQVLMALDPAVARSAAVAAAADLPTGALAHGHALGAVVLPGAPAVVPGVGAGLDPMLLGHVLATVLTAVVLARGEAALWRLLAWLAPLVVALVPVTPAVTPRVRRAAAGAWHRRPRLDALLTRTLTHRGPPVALGA
ncbi:hypothetical protein ACFFKU_02230 [Kineococcus gynurae]|uniref:Integral membrane protein n=1 Tax=Kineococcus gynurae TaxID=452979 RepID=A0ABV5LSL9_9ACTN